jgi:hypothetical protein
MALVPNVKTPAMMPAVTAVTATNIAANLVILLSTLFAPSGLRLPAGAVL